MIGTGRITRGRTNALVLFRNQCRIVQLFIVGISPIIGSYLSVQVFGKCFRQTIGQCLDHNGVVIVMFLFKSLCHFLGAKSGTHTKTTYVVLNTRFFGRDKIGQCNVGHPFPFFGLLAQGPKSKVVLDCAWTDHLNIILIDLVGRKQSKDRFRFQ